VVRWARHCHCALTMVKPAIVDAARKLCFVLFFVFLYWVLLGFLHLSVLGVAFFGTAPSLCLSSVQNAPCPYCSNL
jgi:hypothetical protein